MADNLKQELHKLSNRLEAAKRKLQAAHERADQPIIDKFNEEIAGLEKRIHSIRGTQTRQLGKQGQDLKQMKFRRALTKAEQADMGKLKKSVRGLVVVHPMTKLGKEMGLTEVTGFAMKPF
ncbi:YibL family ribosome-associated protein [Ferrimonas gelatinilytica]|uniref:YibL family ribosome-associated protein n=1 Tax=Ferrimonas gelatinilytica TaxID=1255257 RepID=A0ABP9S8H3_9GAMM